MPVEVHDAFLEAEQVIDSAVDDIDGGGVARLRSQVVLPICNQSIVEHRQWLLEN